MNTGKSIVPSPKPEKNVSSDAAAAISARSTVSKESNLREKGGRAEPTSRQASSVEEGGTDQRMKFFVFFEFEFEFLYAQCFF